MHLRFLSGSLLALLLLSLGFGAGWWLRGPAAGTAPAYQGEALQGRSAYPTRAEQPKADEPARSPQPLLESRPKAHTPAKTQPLHEPQGRMQAFRALLDAQAYSAAMDIYRDTERQNPTEALQLKAIVIESLERYLAEKDGAALTGLVDAFLAHHYDDTDVLLMLAQHQMQSDYFSEAARTFQLAFSYSFAQPDRLQQIRQAFHPFVQAVDDRLTGRDWRELIRFYETLQLLDLTQPRYQLRQAKLYLNHGDPERGHRLLRQLSSQPAVAAQATRLLSSIGSTAGSISANDSDWPTDALPLSVLGDHFHLPLRVNNTLDVNLLIDTGASTTTLSRTKFENIRRRTQFVEIGPQMFNTANGVSRGVVYRVASLQVGRHTLTDINIAVLDFEMPPEIDGLLGMNVLRHFRFQVDQDEQQLLLQPR